MLKKFKIDFYRAAAPQGVDVKAVIDTARKKPKADRTIEVAGKPITLADHGLTANQWHLNMVHIRMGAVPSKASLDGELEAFDLEEDEGMGEETAFLYDCASKVLVAQRNRYGVSAGAFARYLAIVAATDGPIVLTPLIRRDALQKVQSMSVVTKVDFALSSVDNTKQAMREGSGLSGAISTIEFFEAPSAQVTLSVGRRRGGTLDVRKVHRLATDFIRGKLGMPVDRLRVRGHEPGEPMEIVDLLDFCIVDEAEVPLDSDKRAPYAARVAALEEAWNSHKSEIRAMLRE